MGLSGERGSSSSTCTSPNGSATIVAPSAVSGGPGAIPEERAHHARWCDICGRIIAMHQEEDSRLRRLAGGPRGAPGLRCPPLEEWASLAAGLAEPQRRDELLAHASQCDACGAVLHAVMEDFSQELTDAESRSLESLESARPQWQRAVARRMAGATRSRPIYIRTWLARAAAVLVAAGAGWLAWNQWMVSDPARLIASAYTAQRPFDFRIPGGRQAQVRLTRGSGSSFQRPAALLEAEARIARELEKDPQSVKWLGLRARAEILGWDSEAAIATLQRALEQSPDDPDLLADLGMAYALRAETRQNGDVDYKDAIEFLGRSLKAKPSSPEAVFNRAVVLERMYMNEDAGREWRRYLEMDKSGAWHEEAQRRLAALEQKKKSGSRP